MRTFLLLAVTLLFLPLQAFASPPRPGPPVCTLGERCKFSGGYRGFYSGTEYGTCDIAPIFGTPLCCDYYADGVTILACMPPAPPVLASVQTPEMSDYLAFAFVLASLSLFTVIRQRRFA